MMARVGVPNLGESREMALGSQVSSAMAKGIRELLISNEPKRPTAPKIAPALSAQASHGPPMVRAMLVKEPESHEDHPPAAIAANMGKT